jgi:S-(hydroxymethyl)glutathione dehydrogenase / alcohol dehydrogenase
MRAALLNTCPGQLDVEDVDIDAPGPREVLIRTAAAGLCHSDLHFMEGKYPAQTPTVMGHESAGVVEAVGSEVRYVKPGDHVVTCLSVFCGECEHCLTGNPARCAGQGTRRAGSAPPRVRRGDDPVAQFFGLGSFAEQMLVHEHALVKIRDDVPLDVAALLGCGVTTGLGAALNTAKVEAGTTVAVIGCGGIGLSAVQGARIAGAATIIAVDMVESRLDLARKVGATHTIDASAGDAVPQVIELTGGGVHYSFEAIGNKVTAEQSFAMLRPGGTATVIGLIPVGQKVELPGTAFLQERRIQGSAMGSNRFRIDMPRYLELYLQGRLHLDEMVTARIGLDEVNDGFDAMTKVEGARTVIMFD